jgi:hypothetical protein
VGQQLEELHARPVEQWSSRDVALWLRVGLKLPGDSADRFRPGPPWEAKHPERFPQ